MVVPIPLRQPAPALLAVPQAPAARRSLLVPSLIGAVVVLVIAAAVLLRPQATPLVVIDAPPRAIVDAGVAAPGPIDAGAVAVLAPLAIIDASSEAITPLRPRSSPVSAEELANRIRRLKVTLADRDKRVGEPDRILHNLLNSSEELLKNAKTPDERKNVALQLDDLQAQLRH